MEPLQATHWLTVGEAAAEIRAGRLSARELWNACTSQLELLNPQLNAILLPMEEPDETGLAMNGRALHGIPVALKDLFETAGTRTTAGSLFFKDHVAVEDAVEGLPAGLAVGYKGPEPSIGRAADTRPPSIRPGTPEEK